MKTLGNQIQLLPDAVIDQIAAGEVVERPASVVKELVENALDAGAGRIRIDVKDGGKALVAITDDGRGMSPGDARLALSRHATSKITNLADLETVASFGFRGEALPAIASVSRMRLFTRLADSEEGFAINLEAGGVINSGTAGGPPGTRIEVADLFAKIPARRKYLKTESTEWGHIHDWMRRLGLALPGVHFELRRDNKTPIIWPATSDPIDRIAAVLGEGEADALVPVECEDATGHLQAFVSSPEVTRSNANGIYLFVNGRPVRDKVMRHALITAYRDLLPKGRFPSAVLFLTIVGTGVDVNVHPAKWEVRFADSQAIHQLIRRAVRDAMAQRNWLGDASAQPKATDHPLAGPTHPTYHTSGTRSQNARSALATSPTTSSATSVGEPAATDWVLAKRGEANVLPGLEAASSELRSSSLQFGNLRLLGQLLASYLLVEGKEGLLMIDQHAAHERVLYERLRAEWIERGVDRQGLLLSVTVELDPLGASALQRHIETVDRLGFELEPFGESSVVVRAIPALLSGRDPAPLVRDLAEQLQDIPGGETEGAGAELRLLSAADKVFASLACHSARRFGDHLPEHEQQQILRDLDTIPWAPTCPHGRPVAVAYSLPEIERRFARR
ncbi:MAG: DNA mismatch repair endonuclease MutL [Myxococcota bacterium]